MQYCPELKLSNHMYQIIYHYNMYYGFQDIYHNFISSQLHQSYLWDIYRKQFVISHVKLNSLISK